MYKKGRFWVFAGVLVFGWQIAEGTTVHADETPANDDNTQAVVAPTTVSSSDKSVTLTAGSENGGDTQASEKKDDNKTDSASTSQEKPTPDPTVASNNQNSDNQENNVSGKSLDNSKETVSQIPTSKNNSVEGSTTVNQPVETNKPSTESAPTPKPLATGRSNLVKMPVAQTPEAATTIQGVNGTVPWSFDTTTGAMTLGGGTIESPYFSYTDANNTVQSLSRDLIKSMAVTDKLYITGTNGTYTGNENVGLFSHLTNGVTGLDKVDVSQATGLDFLFYGTALSKTVSLNSWDVRKVVTMNALFLQATGVTDFELDNWQTDSLESMYMTFAGMPQLTTINIADWNTSHVTYMWGSFRENAKLTNLDVSKWNVSQVDTFYYTFCETPELKQIDVSKWDVSSATDMDGMFLDSGVQSLDLSNWDMSKVRSTDVIMGYAPNQGSGIDVRELKVGPKFKLVNADPNEWYSPIGQVTEYPYTGKWVNVDTKAVLTYQELCNLYLNSSGGPAATYIAQVDESDRSKLVGKDINLYPNGTLKLAAGVASLQDYRGKDISQQIDTNQLSYVGNVDFSTVGSYPITLIYTSDLGNKFSVPINVNIVKHTSTATLGGQDVIIVLGPSAEDNAAMVQQKMGLLVEGLADNGQKIDISSLSSDKLKLIFQGYADGRPLTNQINYTEPAVFEFIFGYLNSDGILLTHTSFLTLAKTKAAINLKEPTIIVGPTAKLNLADYFDSLDNTLGQKTTDASAVIFTGIDQVDLTRAGDYTINAAYTDSANNPITATTTVHVIKNTAVLELATPAPLIAGPATKFDPASVIKTALTAMGTEMTTANGLTIDSQVKPQKAGTYTVTVSYLDNSGNQLTKSVVVNVVPTQLALTVDPTVNVKVGQSYDPKTSVLTASNATGQDVSAGQLTYSGTVNTAVPGVYQLQVTNQDEFGNRVTKSIAVTVVAEKAGESKPSTTTPDTGTSADTVMVKRNDSTKQPSVAKVSTTMPQPINSQQSAIKPTAIAFPAQAQSTIPNQAKATTLPQTDDQRSALSLLGLGLLAAMALVGIRYKRRRD